MREGAGVRNRFSASPGAVRRWAFRAWRETPTVELRLDWLKSDSERRRLLAWLRRNRPRRAVIVATCRRREGGGLFADSVQDELYWLAQAREAGCLWCDLEIETLRKLPAKSIRQYSLPQRILLSVHDFDGMPPLNASLNARRLLADADAR